MVFQKKEQQAAATAEGAGPKKKKVTAAQLRVQKGPYLKNLGWGRGSILASMGHHQ